MPIAPDLYAPHLARAVDLFRDPTRKDDQKREFRVLVGMLQDEGATVRADDHRVSVNGQPVKTSDVIPLLQRLELHGVSELSIPRDAPVSHVFELLKALADQPGGTEDIDARLRASGAYRVSVSITKLTPFPATPVPTPPSPMPPPARPSMGTGGILRGDPLHDIAPPAVPVGGAGAGDVHQVTP